MGTGIIGHIKASFDFSRNGSYFRCHQTFTEKGGIKEFPRPCGIFECRCAFIEINFEHVCFLGHAWNSFETIHGMMAVVTIRTLDDSAEFIIVRLRMYAWRAKQCMQRTKQVVSLPHQPLAYEPVDHQPAPVARATQQGQMPPAWRPSPVNNRIQISHKFNAYRFGRSLATQIFTQIHMHASIVKPIPRRPVNAPADTARPTPGK